MKLSSANMNTFHPAFQPNFKCQIVADENFEKFAKKMIKNKDNFDDFLFAQEALKTTHKDTFIKIKEDEVNDELIIENLNPQKNQPKIASIGINEDDFVFRKDTAPALYGLLKLADPSTDEHRCILGSSQDVDDAQMHLWNAELNMYEDLDSNPFWKKLQQVNNEINKFDGDTECVDLMSDLHREREEIALALLKSKCAKN